MGSESDVVVGWESTEPIVSQYNNYLLPSTGCSARVKQQFGGTFSRFRLAIESA